MAATYSYSRLLPAQLSKDPETPRSLDSLQRRMARLLRVSLLAPDIVEAIVDGIEPDEMSIEKLRKPLPMLWAEQRSALGC